MRTSVAILEARPETVIQDYGRLLKLVGSQDFCGGTAPVLVPGVKDQRWFPGRGTPPWQLEGILAGCASAGGPGHDELSYMVVSPGKKENPKMRALWGWDNVLLQWGAKALPVDSWNPVPFRPRGHFPALDAALPNGLALPPALWDKPAIMLATPGLGRSQPLFGCVDLLGRLVHLPSGKKPGNIPWSEVLAELLGFTGECLPDSLHVLDAVIWDVPAGHGGHKPVMRHVLLAGRDPLAVDATAMRLLGFEPTALPWVSLASERGVGFAKKKEITILGQPELLDLDFQKRKSTLTSLPDWDNPFWMRDEKRLARWMWHLSGRAAEIKKFRDTSWGRLFDDYRVGKRGAPS